MSYRLNMLDSLKSDHRRRMAEQDFGMIRKCGYMLFWVAAIVLYTGAMYV